MAKHRAPKKPTKRDVGHTGTSAPDNLTTAELVGFYQQMLLIRRFELTVRKLYRRGQISGFIHLYLGEEAVAVGVCQNLGQEDYIVSTHRGHGHVLAKGLPPKIVLAELCAKASGCSGGRGGSMHLYSKDFGIYGTSGLVAAGIPIAVGVALSAKVRQTKHVVVSFLGDGATGHGAFHESLNLAAVQDAPVVFVCENNLYATDTPLHMATRNPEIASKAAAYGMPGIAVDGNDVLAVCQVTRQAVQRARAGNGPTLIEAKTYRVCGHHEGDLRLNAYQTEEELQSWIARCPIDTFRNRLIGWFSDIEPQLTRIEQTVEERVEEAVHFALESPEPDPSTAHDHVFADPINPPIELNQSSEAQTKNWLGAVVEVLADRMRRDPHLIYLGEGIGKRGGSFGQTKGLWQEFGAQRVIDTPLSELGFTGAATGAAAAGCRAVADLMFADFVFDSGSQLISQTAKLRYMSNGQINVPLIIRATIGLIKNTGPHHSGCYYPVWTHQPGLIVAIPSNPADAKGLMGTALQASDPVVFLEHKKLLSARGEVPAGRYCIPFGKAAVVRTGTDLTLVACGYMLVMALEASERLAEEGISSEVIDLRTIVPLDVETIVASVTKTHHLLTVDEAYATCGLGAEIAQTVTEHAFDQLDAPLGRLHVDAVSSPVSPSLEAATYITVEKIIQAGRSIVEGKAIPPWRVAAGRISTQADIGREQPAGKAAPAPPVETGASSQVAQASVQGVPLILPNQDLTVTEATIIRWLKATGDTLAEGEPVVEAETDKAVFEVESPAAGVLAEILVSQGQRLAFGTRIGTISPAE